MTEAFLTNFPEFKDFYGQDVQLELVYSILADNEFVIDIVTDYGIIFGPKDLAKLQLDVYASTPTMDKTLAAEFESFFTMNVNASMYNFIVNMNIPAAIIHSTNITVNNCNLESKDYDIIFTSLVEKAVSGINAKFNGGLDIKKLYPTVGFIAGMFQEFTISPFLIDEFYYAGFKFMLDNSREVFDLQSQSVEFA